jgi:hypothetical protein
MIYDVIEALDISDKTKGYALAAAKRIAETNETGNADVNANDLSEFCSWYRTKEGEDWWNALDDGDDPGIPDLPRTETPLDAKIESIDFGCNTEKVKDLMNWFVKKYGLEEVDE